jgi:hypothetical protein
MKQVTNTQRHPVTPAGAPTIVAHGEGRIDESLPENARLIADGVLTVSQAATPEPRSRTKESTTTKKEMTGE